MSPEVKFHSDKQGICEEKNSAFCWSDDEKPLHSEFLYSFLKNQNVLPTIVVNIIMLKTLNITVKFGLNFIDKKRADNTKFKTNLTV